MCHTAALVALALVTPTAFAQFQIDWYTIEPGGTAQGGSFDIACVIGQPDAGPTLAGGVFSLRGGFLTTGPTTPQCPADLDNGSGTGTPDGGVTIEDLLYFLAVFESGSTAADLDDGSGTGAHDGGVTIEDLLYFVRHFSDGC